MRPTCGLERSTSAEKVGNLIREHSNRLDHKLGHAWADACEALVMWKRGDPEGCDQLDGQGGGSAGRDPDALGFGPDPSADGRPHGRGGRNGGVGRGAQARPRDLRAARGETWSSKRRACSSERSANDRRPRVWARAWLASPLRELEVARLVAATDVEQGDSASSSAWPHEQRARTCRTSIRSSVLRVAGRAGRPDPGCRFHRPTEVHFATPRVRGDLFGHDSHPALPLRSRKPSSRYARPSSTPSGT